ncbi:redoxin domain-containing protein [Actinoplanes sp. NPDC020271]|uniref:redoxin domain-containing protein n=1 Tax=Actinoplanes sp. NPDC020271 TaxID=3363896 RepID=UPI00379BEFDF
MSTRRALLTFPLALAALAACGSPPPAASPAAAAAAGPAPVPASLDFSGTTLDGAPYDAAALAGKPAVLWFWAPWCATCAGQAQSVRDFDEEYAGRIAFLGVAGMGTATAMREFVSDMEVGAVTHLNDPKLKIWTKFTIVEQSTYVLLDAAGTIVTRSYLDDLALTGALKKLAG